MVYGHGGTCSSTVLLVSDTVCASSDRGVVRTEVPGFVEGTIVVRSQRCGLSLEASLEGLVGGEGGETLGEVKKNDSGSGRTSSLRTLLSSRTLTTDYL